MYLARTWLQYLNHVYVIVEDTAETRLMLRHCQLLDIHSYTIFDCPGEATYLLTRNCTNQYYQAAGICCKVDAALDFLIYDNLELYEQVEYVFIIDDDEFVRVDQLFRWLYLLDNAHINDFPLVGNNHQSTYDERGGVWNHKGCKEAHTMGWYQPMMINKKALEVVSASVKVQGISQTCKSFEASQDVSIGVWAWQHELYHIRIPFSRSTGHGEPKNVHPDAMFIHGIKHNKADNCDGMENDVEWMKSRFRYNQTIMIGCGSVDQAVPTHHRTQHFDMYDIWNYFAAKGTDILFYESKEGGLHDWIQSDGRWTPLFTKLVGYNTTRHYRDYKESNIWMPFTPKDCNR